MHDSDSESNEDNTTNKTSFVQRIAKHAAPKGSFHSNLNYSYPYSGLEKAPTKKRRMSKGSREDDDFIVSDEEEEPEEPRSKASSEDDDASASDEDRPKKKNKKVSLYCPICAE